MTKLEELLNTYWSTENRRLQDLLNEIAEDNESLNDMFQELRGILEYLNKEI